MPVIPHATMTIEDELVVVVGDKSNTYALTINQPPGPDGATEIRITDAGGGDIGTLTIGPDRSLTLVPPTYFTEDGTYKQGSLVTITGDGRTVAVADAVPVAS
jgi:hypothetical protein